MNKKKLQVIHVSKLTEYTSNYEEFSDLILQWPTSYENPPHTAGECDKFLFLLYCFSNEVKLVSFTP